MNSHHVAVFLGPSCPLDEAKVYLPNADYFPPASRGSFYDIINDGYKVIVLIDGLFYGKMSVWHKEIMFALDSGIAVIGASSMGALRAAELQGSGITGVGTIFSWYMDGMIDGDDEVALLHEGAEDCYTPVTIPLVTLRWNLKRAIARGLIDQRSETLIIECAKQMCFTDRTLEGILTPLKNEIDVNAVMEALADAEDIKKIDATLALRMAAQMASSAIASPAPKVRDYEYIHINLGIEYYSSERLTSIKAKGNGTEISLAEYLGRIDTDHPGYRDLVRARICQRLIVGWARELHIEGVAEDDGISVWDSEALDLDHRRATGLTLIDIARERRDDALCSRMQERFCSPDTDALVAAVDLQLSRHRQDAPIAWQRMVVLTGQLVYTMYCMGLKKQIRPKQNKDLQQSTRLQEDAILAEATRVLAYAEWIYEVGPRIFGYVLDPAREVLLAHQYLNCMDRLNKEAA